MSAIGPRDLPPAYDTLPDALPPLYVAPDAVGPVPAHEAIAGAAPAARPLPLTPDERVAALMARIIPELNLDDRTAINFTRDFAPAFIRNFTPVMLTDSFITVNQPINVGWGNTFSYFSSLNGWTAPYEFICIGEVRGESRWIGLVPKEAFKFARIDSITKNGPFENREGNRVYNSGRAEYWWPGLVARDPIHF